jgi:hypothetical protein
MSEEQIARPEGVASHNGENQRALQSVSRSESITWEVIGELTLLYYDATL